MENNNVFDDMPEAPKPPKLPKFFPDIIVKNQRLASPQNIKQSIKKQQQIKQKVRSKTRWKLGLISDGS